jgi:hypothetical protein
MTFPVDGFIGVTRFYGFFLIAVTEHGDVNRRGDPGAARLPFDQAHWALY